MLNRYVVECQIPVDVFWDSTWYELELLARQYLRRVEDQWEHTRLVVAALTGEKPEQIIKLSKDTERKHTTTSKSDAHRILEERQKLKARLHE